MEKEKRKSHKKTLRLGSVESVRRVGKCSSVVKKNNFVLNEVSLMPAICLRSLFILI